MVGEHLDLTSDVPRATTSSAASSSGEASSSDAANAAAACGDGGGSRKFVGVRFECCAVYTRVYVNREETAYEGRCPRCARPLRLEIGPGGTDARFFSAY